MADTEVLKVSHREALNLLSGDDTLTIHHFCFIDSRLHRMSGVWADVTSGRPRAKVRFIDDAIYNGTGQLAPAGGETD